MIRQMNSIQSYSIQRLHHKRNSSNDLLGFFTSVKKICYTKVAIDLIKQRYPKGWGGAAVVHTDKDHYFTSVALDTYNSSSTLCMETGAILEVCKYNEKITHCLCVVRDDEYAPFKILTPCGICQERLRYWGSTVRVGVTMPNQELCFVTLDVLQPYHWTNAYEKEELEHYQADK